MESGSCQSHSQDSKACWSTTREMKSLPFEGHKKLTCISQQNLMKVTRLPSAICTHPEDNSIAGKGFISPDYTVPLFNYSLFPEKKLSGSIDKFTPFFLGTPLHF